MANILAIRQLIKRGNVKEVSRVLNENCERLSNSYLQMVIRAIFQPDEKENTSLHYCAKKNHRNMAELILNFEARHKVRIQMKNIIADLASTDPLKENIKNGLMESKGQDGVLPLHLAAAYYGKGNDCVSEDEEECKFKNSVLGLFLKFLSKKRKLFLLDREDKYGMTPLHHSLIRGNTERVCNSL